MKKTEDMEMMERLEDLEDEIEEALLEMEEDIPPSILDIINHTIDQSMNIRKEDLLKNICLN